VKLRPAGGADLGALFVAESQQDAHRLNCFAEGVGVLLGAILAAIGLHGLCLLRGGTSAARLPPRALPYHNRNGELIRTPGRAIA
jgi:hypothetical protein